jgi:enoyl-CoA hydratase/carnithine racemase
VESKPVLCERDGLVAVITLNRPEKLNAISRALSEALAAAVRELEADEGVRAIVLPGAGDRAFSAGADMGEGVEQLEGRGEGNRAGEGIGAVAAATKPVIAAINGYCYGGATLLAMAADIRLASPNARFRFVGASYGLVVGGSQLPRIVGPAYAKELIFTTRVIDAAEAERIGLVNRVLPAETLLAEAVQMGKEIAAVSPFAVRWAKKVIDAATEVDQGRAVEQEANRALRGSPDHTSRFKAAAGRIVTPER